ncbi:MAG: HypC/HybG/HupF family hydrogenase formation chaperone [Planctomycetes bacterium]|nr:HypC/HybG/HupF family hydrogenase formation chaperone [Planctomycetota bacterium]
MCLGIPGQVVAIEPDGVGPLIHGNVQFGTIQKRVCLAYVPEVCVGDWVIVHVGFAISRLDEDEARQVLALLAEMGELAALEEPPQAAVAPEPRGPEPARP